MYADDVQLYRSTCIGNIRLRIDSINDDDQLCINPSKSKGLLLSRTKRAFDAPDIIIRRNKIDFLESAFNMGVIFNDRLTRSNHNNIIVDKVYDMLRNLWAVIDSTPFAIRMQWAKTFLIPVLLSGS